SADEKTQNKNVKNREVQVKALTKQKQDHLDVGVFYLKEMSEPNPTCSSEENVLTSQSQKSTHMGKTKKDALRQDSPNQKKKAEAEELMLSWSGLETKPPDEEQCKTRMLPSEDLPMPSSGHQEEQTVSLKRSLKSSKNLQLTSEASQHLLKKQTAKQKLPEVQVAERGTVSPRKKLKKSVRKSSNKKPQLEREESSDSESREKELEREPVELSEVCTTPLHQKLETPVIQKLTKREKRRNVLHTAESPGDANNRTPLNTLQQPMDNMQKPEKKRSSAKPSGKISKKRSSAKPSGKIPKKIPRGTNKALWSSPEDTEAQTDSDSSAVQDVPRKKQKLWDVKLESNKRQHNRQHGPQCICFFLCSGPVLEDSDEFTSCSLSSDACSDTSEDFRHVLRHLLSHGIARHKIVMPSNTPNVRRTKRVRLKPLEYWRGEHVTYTRPSGERMKSGVVHPETKSPRKIERRKDDPKQKREETKRREIPGNVYHILSDISKPVIVVDAVKNVEVYLDCINGANSRTSYMRSDILEVHKTFDTSLFATGKLILKPLKEKGCEFVHMNTMVFHMLHGKVILTLHRAQYYLTAGDCFFVPAGNEYNLRNLLNEASVFFFTHLK
ncbi:CENPC protein, partial [Orthonyx spaldingii]|nr:CENPC protein [Orthonyx spaldingii]